MKNTITMAASSALEAIENVRAWYAGLNIELRCPPTCARRERGVYDVTVRTV